MRSNAQRLRGETVSLMIEVPAPANSPADSPPIRHNVEMTMAYREDGHLHEIAFVSRKLGSAIDLLLRDLGLRVSRAIQGRDPDTGDLAIEKVDG
jgi:hypothetical protein